MSEQTNNEQTNNEGAACGLARRALLELDGFSLDSFALSRTEFVVPLKSYEHARALPETWPAEVRAIAGRAVDEWRAERIDRVVMAVTYGAVRDDHDRLMCVLILHHAPREV